MIATPVPSALGDASALRSVNALVTGALAARPAGTSLQARRFSPTPRRTLAVACILLTLSTRALAGDPPNTPQPMPLPPDNAGSADAQDLPYRFRDMLRFEADRARSERYFVGSVYTLTGVGIVSAGAVTFATIQADDRNGDAKRAQAYIMMGAGGAAVGGALFLTFMPSSAEQLDKSYSAYANDIRVPASTRLYWGEQALRIMARRDMIARRIVGTTSIAIGVGLAFLAVWRSTLTESTPSDRAVSVTLAAASSLVTVGEGVAQLWFLRGSAEVTLAHWEASQGRFHDALNRPSLTPFVVPNLRGATAGILLEL